MRPALLLPLLCATMSTVGACKHAAAAGGSDAPPAISEHHDEDGLLVQEVDLNADGQPEVWNYFRERSETSRVRVLKKLDLNFDGKVDVISTFDEAGAMKTEEIDGDFDGQFDWVDHYKDGNRVLAEVDTNFDGRPDTFYYYTVGGDGQPHLDRKERDSTNDGRIDLWERYDMEGNVVRVARDIDGDGKMDTLED